MADHPIALINQMPRDQPGAQYLINTHHVKAIGRFNTRGHKEERRTRSNVGEQCHGRYAWCDHHNGFDCLKSASA